MKPDSDKLFVYGTLMQGEERCGYLADCDLIGGSSLPGRLYDTKRGYPAAVFGEFSGALVSGEVYAMSSPVTTLKELDEVEGVSGGLYRRVLMEYGRGGIYTYAAGPELLRALTDDDIIEGGVWRPNSSLALESPVRFALGFEHIQRKHYRTRVSRECGGLVYHRGLLPVLVTAPHASVHRRLGKLKRQEFYTGAIAVSLHALTGAHSLCTNRLMDTDPNYYDDSHFKTRMSDIVRGSAIRLVVDIHGTGTEKAADIYPGVGSDNEFLRGKESYLDALKLKVSECGLAMGGAHVFPAARQMTVAKYAARKLGIPALQLEINKRLRQPGTDPDGYLKMLSCLAEFISGLGLSG